MEDGYIALRGVRVNNLKNIDVDIPRNRLVVITGLSGSGKSSLAFDTLYADGQRRYVESLSSYARQFMGRISKPDVDSIKGIPPAIAIEQKVISRNPRSTVGTTTEIYEYLKLLFAKAGRTFSPVSGEEVRRDRVENVFSLIHDLEPDSKVFVLAPVRIVSGRTLQEQLEVLKKQGYSRVTKAGELQYIDDLLAGKGKFEEDGIFVLIDRFRASMATENSVRVTGSVETAFYEGKGVCAVQVENAQGRTVHQFSNRFERDGIVFEEPSVNLFSFNNPYGACPTCGGLGMVEGIDMDMVIPDRTLSVFEGAVACWRGEKLGEWRNWFVKNAAKVGFPIHRAVEDLSEQEYELLCNGDPAANVYGVKQFFEYVEETIYKIQYRVIQSRYRGRTLCPDCKGTRIRKDANYVKIGGKSISDLILMPVDTLYDFLTNVEFETEQEKMVSQRVMTELVNRIGFLKDVGLGYLTLNRLSRTLSGGESQRINLATSLGSSLVGSLYILDEPSIGLHPRDTENLIRVLKRLRDIGNTVVVVEHDEEIIRSADYIVDIGPKAGRLGGEVVFKGTVEELLKDEHSLTAAYLRGMSSPSSANAMSVPLPAKRRKWRNYIEITGANEHNLKNVNVKIPLEVLVVVTGVSGSGKSTLVKDILSPALGRILHETAEKPGRYRRIDADFSKISDVVVVDQSPIGRSTRSNPVTYVKAYDDIRELFSMQPLAKQRNYKAGFFSFNIPGGRCEECEGEGVIRIGMQFMADVELVCSECGGKRFKDEVLDVKVNGQTITDLLDMTVNQAVDFFENLPQPNKTVMNIIGKLKPLQDVGLGYLKLGQTSSTLSGGEAQRVKLAYYLARGTENQHTLFIFDEPTTGLHFHDIGKLYHSFDRLIEKGNSIIVIEHNLEIIKCADWIIDLGPDGGERGGQVVCEGTPEQIVGSEKSYTGQYLKPKLSV